MSKVDELITFSLRLEMYSLITAAQDLKGLTPFIRCFTAGLIFDNGVHFS